MKCSVPRGSGIGTTLFICLLGCGGGAKGVGEGSASEASTAPAASAGTSSSGGATTATTSQDGTTHAGEDTESPPGSCDIWLQDCPDGQKCNAWSEGDNGTWDAWRCVPLDPAPDSAWYPCAVSGGPFSGVDSCDAGQMCFGVDPRTNEGVCVPLCQGSLTDCIESPASCCEPGYSCAISANAVLALCTPWCDPLQDACFELGECLPIGGGFECVSTSSDLGGLGDACGAGALCGGGLYCGDSSVDSGCAQDVPGCCLPLCDLDAPMCVAGTVCKPWFEGAPPAGFEDLGYCAGP